MTYDKDSFLAGLSVGMSLRYSKRIPAPPNYLTFSSPSSFTLTTNAQKNTWDGILEYSDDAVNWIVWDGTTLTSSNISGAFKLYIRGTGNTQISTYIPPGTSRISNRWIINGSNVSCYGDIRTLLDYTNPENTTMETECFAYMFYTCTALISPPNLPATTLSYGCYYQMFNHCTSLTTAPSLPATTLAHNCYSNMFDGCVSLVFPPALPSTVLKTDCYRMMFEGCTSLSSVPSLPSTTLASSCYKRMFKGCTALTSLPELPATETANGCYEQMFDGCQNIKLSSTKTREYQTEFRIPSHGTAISPTPGLKNMFANTGGTYTGTPLPNKTYYTSNTVIS